MFARWKAMKSTLHWHDYEEEISLASAKQLPAINTGSGPVDASCNRTITINCLKQLYNTVGYHPSSAAINNIGITGYLEEFANVKDLQLFYADQLPAAVGSKFKFVSVKGKSKSCH